MGSLTVLDSTGATQTVNNAVVADGATWIDGSTQHALVGGVYEASPTTSANNTVRAIRTSATGELVVAPGSAEDTAIGGVRVMSAGTEYETVAASQTAQVLGATGATGDYIEGILVIPATTTPGVITLLDNATSISLFVGGASSVSNLVPFYIPLGLKSISGAWKITTGANVSCICSGNFT